MPDYADHADRPGRLPGACAGGTRWNGYRCVTDPAGSTCPSPGEIRDANGQCYDPTMGGGPPGSVPQPHSQGGPVACPDGQIWSPTLNTCIWDQGPAPGTGGGDPAAGGPAGGAAGGGSYGSSALGGGKGGGVADPGFGISHLISDRLSGILSGAETRFNPKVMSSLQGRMLRDRENQISQTRSRIEEDAIRRGVFRSPATSALTADAIRGAHSEFTQGQAQLYVAKVNADHNDKMEAITSSQKWLDSIRDFAIKSELTSVEWAKTKTALELGYANIANQLKIANLQYQAALVGAQTAYDISVNQLAMG